MIDELFFVELIKWNEVGDVDDELAGVGRMLLDEKLPLQNDCWCCWINIGSEVVEDEDEDVHELGEDESDDEDDIGEIMLDDEQEEEEPVDVGVKWNIFIWELFAPDGTSKVGVLDTDEAGVNKLFVTAAAAAAAISLSLAGSMKADTDSFCVTVWWIFESKLLALFWLLVDCDISS